MQTGALFSMRLSPRQINTLKSAVSRHFGPGARVWLFGSRLDDGRRGGDYDFYLETELTNPDQILDGKIHLLADLHATPEFEDEKIDVVIRPLASWSTELPIYRIARQEGIAL
ncbi:MAG: nucleotidyltransferase domain-containing protein [Methylococcaceae bacterium]|nr:nucleotidyltransferase domain-containing protein [Methylococcaceae bacterium]